MREFVWGKALQNMIHLKVAHSSRDKTGGFQQTYLLFKPNTCAIKVVLCLVHLKY